MLKIGLTGGIASGKSTACRFFKDLGITIIDADHIARELVNIGEPCYQEIVASFGKEILFGTGEINRAQLRQRIFSDQKAKQRLEQILHPAIRRQLIKQSQTANSAYCILAIPLLIEADMTDLVDRIVVIDIEQERQLQRLCQRDDCSTEQAEKLINSQCSRQQRLNYANDVIINTSSVEYLKENILTLHQKYLDLAVSLSNGCQSPNCHGE